MNKKTEEAIERVEHVFNHVMGKKVRHVVVNGHFTTKTTAERVASSEQPQTHGKNLTTLQFQNNPTSFFLDDSGNLWWIAKEVCKILNLEDVYRAVQYLDDDEKGTTKVRTPGGPQEMIVISESGLYTLIFRSNKAEAKAFRKWVTSTVLPAIRKTGAFASGKSVAKLTIFLNDVAAAGYCSFNTLKEYCWLRTLGLPLDTAGRASNMGSTHQIQAVDRKLKAVGVRFPNLLFASRRKIMDDAFETLLAEAEMSAVGDAIAAKEVANV